MFRFVRNGKAGYIDASGKVVIQPILPFNGTWGGEFHEGLLQIDEEEGARFVDVSGKTAFHTDAWYAEDFSEGLSAVRVRMPSGDSKASLVDKSGRFVIPLTFADVRSLSEGLARFSVSAGLGTTGYLDKTGTVVIPPNLSDGSDFHQGRAAVIASGPCRITNGGSCERSDYKPTRRSAGYDCKWSYIDRSGRQISDLRFDDALDFSEGLAGVYMSNRWGFIDLSGKIAIQPGFENVGAFSEGLASASQGGKTGFINRYGAFLIGPQFDAVEPFSNGRALVTTYGPNSESNKSWFINKNGRTAFPGEFLTASSFHRGLAHVQIDDERFAWINTEGKEVFTYSTK